MKAPIDCARQCRGPHQRCQQRSLPQREQPRDSEAISHQRHHTPQAALRLSNHGCDQTRNPFRQHGNQSQCYGHGMVGGNLSERPPDRHQPKPHDHRSGNLERNESQHQRNDPGQTQDERNRPVQHRVPGPRTICFMRRVPHVQRRRERTSQARRQYRPQAICEQRRGGGKIIARGLHRLKNHQRSHRIQQPEWQHDRAIPPPVRMSEDCQHIRWMRQINRRHRHPGHRRVVDMERPQHTHQSGPKSNRGQRWGNSPR